MVTCYCCLTQEQALKLQCLQASPKIGSCEQGIRQGLQRFGKVTRYWSVIPGTGSKAAMLAGITKEAPGTASQERTGNSERGGGRGPQRSGAERSPSGEARPQARPPLQDWYCIAIVPRHT